MNWKQLENQYEFHRLSVEAEWSELIADYNDLISGYRKLSIPGFRPGKVPQALIVRRFAKEIFEDLSQRSAQRFGREAIREAGIEAWGTVEMENVVCEKGERFFAELRFIPFPEIKLPDFQTLKNKDRDQISLALLEKIQLKVPDSLVAAELALEGIDNHPDSPGWVAAADRVKLLVILKQIARQEGIEVDEKDVKDRISEKAIEFGTTSKKLLQELTGEQSGGLQHLREMLLAESTLDYLIDHKPLEKMV